MDWKKQYKKQDPCNPSEDIYTSLLKYSEFLESKLNEIGNKICKNCKFYKAPINNYNIKKDRGECSSSKIVYDPDCDKKIHPLNDKLEYSDHDGYDAYFYVGENFGCINWEKR